MYQSKALLKYLLADQTQFFFFLKELPSILVCDWEHVHQFQRSWKKEREELQSLFEVK